MVEGVVLSEDKLLVLWYSLPGFPAQLHGQVVGDSIPHSTPCWLPGVIADLPTLIGVLKELVLSHAMTGVEDDPVAHQVMVVRRVVVKAVAGHASVLQHSKHPRPVLRDVDIRIDVLQVPLEVLTSQLGPEPPPVCHVPKGFQASVGVTVVVQLLVVVHPDLGSTHAVGQGLTPRIGGLLGEDVAHVGAGVDLQAAPALPDPE